MKNASARAMLILLAGLLGCFAAPSLAAATGTAASAKTDDASADTGKSVRHKHHYAHHHASRRAAQSSDDRTDKADRKTSARNDASNEIAGNDFTANAVPASSTMPPMVANANALLAAADTPVAAAASAMTARANDNVQQAAAETDQAQPAQEAQPAADNADNQAVTSDQLSDSDRALHDDSQTAAPAKPAVAAPDPQPRRAAAVTAATENSTWDQTSLIGKIFIGFGALLTLASAARMFMA